MLIQCIKTSVFFVYSVVGLLNRILSLSRTHRVPSQAYQKNSYPSFHQKVTSENLAFGVRTCIFLI
jgi:hypothetical protein